MADLALVTAGQLRVVASYIQKDFDRAEAIAIGAAARIDTANGKATNANGTTTAENRIFGVCVDTLASTVTLLMQGVIDGYDLSALAWDAAVYLSDTDGTLSSTAGTVSTIIGRVVPGFDELTGAANAKLLFVNIPKLF